ncbi:MAG: NAD(P)H-hydrate dehydratase [Planctomycetales bacterium]|nr:NAD(P)H-hydrate dehydratase [bacterium]UNM08411.1 MAG: NAD(P)H-hydrate dehydratase [Planctomycetales bacterium]
MKPVLTAVEMGQLDKFTIESHGLDGKILMSNAARSVLDQIRQRWPNVRRPVIFAGTGNNGGDGLALAYYAQQAGMNPLLLLCHPQITDPPTLSMDATYFYRIAQRAYVSMDFLTKPVLIPEILGNHNCDLIVDSIFGTGLAGQLDNYYVNIIDRMNISSAPILAIDCPSGLDSTTGEVISRSVQADLTVTMGYAKRGFYHPGAVRYVGDLQVADLGFASISEAGIAPASHAWQEALWEPLRTWRSADTHKGDYGRLLIVAGSRKYPGAPRLAANAALRGGVGLVRLVVPEDIYAVCCDNPALMVSAHPTDGKGGFASEPDAELLEHMEWADALVIGPGLSDAPHGLQLAGALLEKRNFPVVVDADALRALPENPKPGGWPMVLTPHIGELARLAGQIPDETWDNLFQVATELSFRLHALVLAKSNQCLLTTPEGALIFPHKGHPALATGGTGDVLAGMIGALLARYHAMVRSPELRFETTASTRRLTVAEITVSAVNWHALAARLAVAQLGEDGLTSTDLIGFLPQALRILCEKADGQRGDAGRPA